MNRLSMIVSGLAVFFLSLAAARAAGPQEEAARILEQCGAAGGLIIHVGCGDGALTAALRRSETYVVHGLDADPANVAAARRRIQSLGLYGPVSIELLRDRHLPYVDNMANVVVVDDLDAVAMSEVMRVLAPLGAACVRRGGQWETRVKPWPEPLDAWPMFLHGADNNAVGRDRRAGVPRSIQWVAKPEWTRSHEELASMSAAVAARGRLYYIMDEGPLASIRFPARWRLVARDAFNGLLLWERDMGVWVDPLRHFRSGPAHLPRRLAAAGDELYVTLSLDAPVSALDGRTGETLRQYAGTERTEEILVDGGVLYLVAGSSEVKRRGGGLFARTEPPPAPFRHVLAVEAASGRILWRKDFTNEYWMPLSLAVRNGRVYGQTVRGVVCLDASSGELLWRTPRRTPAKRMAFSGPTLVATDEVVLCADRDVKPGEQDAASAGGIEWGVHGWNEPGFDRKPACTLTAYDARDGRELWSAPCREGYNSPVDVFVVGGVVFASPDFRGYDLKTGELKQQVNTSGPKVGMSHHRCYRNKATERFLFMGKSGVEVVDWERGWLSNNSWLRGTCQYGIIPANGMVYAPPDPCACFLTVKAPGFFAAAPQRDATLEMPFPDRPVVERGPAYGEPLDAPAAPEDWPAFRHDALRSGVAATRMPEPPHIRWTADVGGRLTQPVAAGGRVFVASTDAHLLYALDQATGRERWRFTAGGRIDSPPAVYRGRVLFGAADGWVYCLNAADGRLAWRFRAAPAERWVSAYGQLESIWPVHGAVLVQNGEVYAAAGRSTYLDGGIVLHRLDPQTGQPRSRTVLTHLDPKTGRQLVSEARFNMEGTTSDVLTGDGERVYLKYFAFDKQGRRTEESQPHLFSLTSLLGEEWFVRSYWVLGQGMPGAGWGGWADAAHQFPFGRILCFDNTDVYGYGRTEVQAGPVGHRADTYHLFRMKRQPSPGAKPQYTRKGRPQQQPPEKGDLVWSDTDSLIVRAMVVGQQRIAVAGVPDVGQKLSDLLAFANPDEALAAFEGRKGALLRVVDKETGQAGAEIRLPAPPVFDGMAAARGQLLLSLRNGQVCCVGQ